MKNKRKKSLIGWTNTGWILTYAHPNWKGKCFHSGICKKRITYLADKKVKITIKEL